MFFEIAISELESNSSYDFIVEFDGETVYASRLESDEDGEASVRLTSDENDEVGEYRFVLMRENVEVASVDFEITEVAITGEPDEAQSIDSEARTIHLTNEEYSASLVFEGHAGEVIHLIVELESGEVEHLNIVVEQDGLSLLDYETGGLPERASFGFVVPDDGLVTIQVEDNALVEAVLKFSIERE